MEYSFSDDSGSDFDFSPISAVDLFCGAGGLTYGLRKAGIKVEAGVDIDPQSRFAFEANNPGSNFFQWDISKKNSSSIRKLFDESRVRLLAGCAPCQPFSKYTQAIKKHRAWDLLDNFSRFVEGIKPELVTMENVPQLADRGSDVLDRFIKSLVKIGYCLDWKIVNCCDYGIPQTRKRLVLLASLLGDIKIPDGSHSDPSRWKTAGSVIGRLKPLQSGEVDSSDPMHCAPLLSDKNLKRIRATKHNGGTRRDWPEELWLDCHRKKSGETYHSIYARMWMDRPAPTMTTLCTGIGNGRFGHPNQDRSITLREAALFQSFPKSYQFWPKSEKLSKQAVGRLIGNAVPPKLAKALGHAVLNHVSDMHSEEIN